MAVSGGDQHEADEDGPPDSEPDDGQPGDGQPGDGQPGDGQPGDGQPTRYAVTVPPEQAGQRLDRVLAAHLADAAPGLSRSRVQALIRDGAVTDASGRTIRDGGARVKQGDCFTVDVPPAAPPEPAGEAIPLVVVHEDDALIVVDKPAGLVVHPAAGHATGTLVNALIAHCGASLSGIGGVKRPGIVHRLDKDTSGLLVVAKTDAAHSGLAAQFAAHGADGRLRRAYLALCWGCPTPRTGRIEADLARSETNRTRIAVVRPGGPGRHAATRYAVERVFAAGGRQAAVAQLRLELETGRTHQIRVHMAHIGHPLLGDAVYGTSHKASANILLDEARAKLAALGRQALHAAELGFEHPITGRPMHFVSPPPADLTALSTALGASSGPAADPMPGRRGRGEADGGRPPRRRRGE